MNQRLMLYRKVAAARRDDEIDRVLEEAADRYGPLPDSVLNLADYGRIRVMADRLGIDTIDREGRIVVLKFRPQAKVDPVRLVALVRQRPELTLVPPAALKLNLDAAMAELSHQPSAHQPMASRAARRSQAARAPSWWTGARSRGEVKARLYQGRNDRGPPARTRGRPAGCSSDVGGLLSDLARIRDKIFSSRILMAKHQALRSSLVAASARRGQRGDARGNHRADPREGERRDLHQERSRTAPGGGAAAEGPAVRPQERSSNDQQLRKALDEITPQIMVEAVDEMVVVQRGKELGYKLSDEQFKQRRRQHPQGKQDRDRRAVSGRAQVREHDDGRPAPEPRAAR